MRFPTTEDLGDRAIRTCYPAATIDANAEPVALSGTDIGGIDIRVQRNRAFKVTGTVIDSSGLPIEHADIMLVAVGKHGSVSGSVDRRTRGGGQFIALGVTPGEYVVQVAIGSRLNPDDKRERELGHAAIRVDNADVHGIVVTTTRLATVAGRIIFEDSAPENRSEPMRVGAESSSTPGAIGFGTSSSAEVRSDFTFELTGLFGPQILTVYRPAPRLDCQVREVPRRHRHGHGRLSSRRAPIRRHSKSP